MPKRSLKKINSGETLSELIEAHERFITSRPHSEHEIRRHFAKYLTAPNDLDKLIEQLRAHGHVDDMLFVSWWVDQRSTFKQKGKRMLTAELRQCGVKKELIDTFFETHELPESDLARTALQKKMARFMREGLKGRAQKAISYLVRRGFTYDAAKTAFEELFGIK